MGSNNIIKIGCYNDDIKNKFHNIDHNKSVFSLSDCIEHAYGNKHCGDKKMCNYIAFNNNNNKCYVGGSELDNIKFENKKCNFPIYLTPSKETNDNDPDSIIKKRMLYSIDEKIQNLKEKKNKTNLNLNYLNNYKYAINNNTTIDKVINKQKKNNNYKTNVELGKEYVQNSNDAVKKHSDLYIQTEFKGTYLTKEKERLLEKKNIIKDNLNKIVNLNNSISTISQEINNNNTLSFVRDKFIFNLKLLLWGVLLTLFVFIVYLCIKSGRNFNR